jgi:HlyD family secretion protein
VEVVTGISDGAYTEIVSGQIKEGDEVIIEAISNKANTQTPGQPQGPRFF